MTDLGPLVRGLPHQSKIILTQIRVNPGTKVPYPIPAGLDTLLVQGLANAADGRLSVSPLGKAVLRYLELDQYFDTEVRLLNVYSTVLSCGGQVDGLEQTFRNDFTPDERDLARVALEKQLAAIDAAEK